MGCDIHAVVQARDGGGWKDVHSTWDQDRHYFLFGWLAGVCRPEMTPVAEPRGFPADFALVEGDTHPTTLEAYCDRRKEWLDEDERGNPTYWMGDHTYSWLTADEILAAEVPQSQDGDVLRYFVDEVKRLKDEHGEVRIVFGFDS